MPTLTLLNDLSPAAVEQCRSSPAAAFIREYKGECRFTPPADQDYIVMANDTEPGIINFLPTYKEYFNERPTTKS